MSFPDAEQFGNNETQSEGREHTASRVFAHLSLGLIECRSALIEQLLESLFNLFPCTLYTLFSLRTGISDILGCSALDRVSQSGNVFA